MKKDLAPDNEIENVPSAKGQWHAPVLTEYDLRSAETAGTNRSDSGSDNS